MDNNDINDIEINFVIARLTTLTNQAKIYGGEKVLARCDAKQTAEQVFDMFNRALTAIHTLQREIKIRQTEKADSVEAHQAYCEFLLGRARERGHLPLNDLTFR